MPPIIIKAGTTYILYFWSKEGKRQLVFLGYQKNTFNTWKTFFVIHYQLYTFGFDRAAADVPGLIE